MLTNKDITLLGDKILIQLHEGTTAEVHTDLKLPKFENELSDGGRPRAKQAKNKDFVPIGTVLQISPLAQESLNKASSDLKVGDQVVISAAAGNYRVYSTYTSTQATWEGLIMPPPHLIEFKFSSEKR